MSVLVVFRSVEAALEGYPQRDDGHLVVWCQNLQMRNREPTVSTAFGIKAVLLIEEATKADLGALGNRLDEGAMPDGGWAASYQVRSRPESIVVVIDVIVSVDPTSDISQHLDLLEKRLDAVTWQRPFINRQKWPSFQPALTDVFAAEPENRIAREERGGGKTSVVGSPM